MTYQKWSNCALESQRISYSRLRQDALARLVQSTDTIWAANPASLEYHLKCKKTYLVHQKLKVDQNVRSLFDIPMPRPILPITRGLSVQDTIPESRLAKYGNFYYNPDDTLFKTFHESIDVNVPTGKEPAAPVVLEPWQEICESEVFRNICQPLGLNNVVDYAKDSDKIEESCHKTDSEEQIGQDNDNACASPYLDFMMTISASKVGTSPGRVNEDNWPMTYRDSCMLCKIPSCYLMEYIEWLQLERNLPFSDKEVLLAPNPVLKFSSEGEFKKLIQGLTSPRVQGLWLVTENSAITENKTWMTNQKWTNVNKNFPCSFGKLSESLLFEETDSEDSSDDADVEPPSISYPILERCILAKYKELLHLIDQDNDSDAGVNRHQQGCGSKHGNQYWEYVNPGQICNQLDISPRTQSYAEVCSAKAARTSNPRFHINCKKSKSQSILSASSGQQKIKSTFSHDNLSPTSPSVFHQTTDSWPSLTSPTLSKTRSAAFPRLSSSVQCLPQSSKKVKKARSKPHDKSSLLHLNLRSQPAISPIENQRAAATSTVAVTPRAITGAQNWDCRSEDKKFTTSKHHPWHTPKALSQRSSASRIDDCSSVNGFCNPVPNNQTYGPGEMMPNCYKKYHWHAPAAASQASKASSKDERSLDLGTTKQGNQNSHYYANNHGAVAVDANSAATKNNVLQTDYGFSQLKNAHCSANNFQNLQLGHNSIHQQNSYQNAYLWISNNFVNNWRVQNPVVPAVQYHVNSFVTSTPIVRFPEMTITPTTTTSSSQWKWYRARLQDSWPAIGHHPSNANSNFANYGIASKTSHPKDASCVVLKQISPQSHQRKPRKLRNLIDVIGAQLRESVVALPKDSINASRQESMDNIGTRNVGNIAEPQPVVSVDRCKAVVEHSGKTAPSLPVKSDQETDSNSTKLMQGLGIFKSEERQVLDSDFN